MVKGTTPNGFRFSVDTDRLKDDWEFAELAVKAKTDENAAFEVVRVMLGGKQYDNLKEYIRRKRGYVSTKMMKSEMEYIMHYDGGDNSLKNS